MTSKWLVIGTKDGESVTISIDDSKEEAITETGILGMCSEWDGVELSVMEIGVEGEVKEDILDKADGRIIYSFAAALEVGE